MSGKLDLFEKSVRLCNRILAEVDEIDHVTDEETSLLNRFLYRGKNQHKSGKHFSLLKQAFRLFKKITVLKKKWTDACRTVTGLSGNRDTRLLDKTAFDCDKVLLRYYVFLVKMCGVSLAATVYVNACEDRGFSLA